MWGGLGRRRGAACALIVRELRACALGEAGRRVALAVLNLHEEISRECGVAHALDATGRGPALLADVVAKWPSLVGAGPPPFLKTLGGENGGGQALLHFSSLRVIVLLLLHSPPCGCDPHFDRAPVSGRPYKIQRKRNSHTLTPTPNTAQNRGPTASMRQCVSRERRACATRRHRSSARPKRAP